MTVYGDAKAESLNYSAGCKLQRRVPAASNQQEQQELTAAEVVESH